MNLAVSQKFDVSTLLLYANRAHLHNEIKDEFDRLVVILKKIMLSNSILKPQLSTINENIFNLRVKAIRWLLKEGVALDEPLEELYFLVNKLGNNPRYSVIYENILFALRCIKRLTNSFHEQSFQYKYESTDFPDISYVQFTESLIYIPNDILATKIHQWLDSSLYIENSILAISVINEHNIDITDKTLNELAQLIANSAQEYTALAIELGYMSTPAYFINNADESDTDFIKEQKLLADSDLNAYYEKLEP